MDHFAPELSLDMPSPNLHFDTFSSFTMPDGNGSNSALAQATVAENFFRSLSEKIGRGLSGASDSENALNVIRNKVVLNGSIGSNDFPNEDWIRQAEYDKFMNEIWIGIVLTLIVISMVFCICSCFLYHQFRQWKNNYHRNIQQNSDMESIKLNIEDDDLPNYTLVSGLPSYDAAMEQLHRSSTSNTCLLMYPSVLRIFTNEKQDSFESLRPHHHIQTHRSNSATSTTHEFLTTVTTVPSYEDAVFGTCQTKSDAVAPSYQETLLSNNTDSH